MSFPWWLPIARLRIRKYGVRVVFFFRWGGCKTTCCSVVHPILGSLTATLPFTTFQSSCLVVSCVFHGLELNIIGIRKKKNIMPSCLDQKSSDITFQKEVLLKISRRPRWKKKKIGEQHMLRTHIVNLGEKLHSLGFNNL